MYKHILVPVDVGEAGSWEKAFETTRKLADTFSAQVTVMTVIPDLRTGAVAQYFPADYEKAAIAEETEELKSIIGKVPTLKDAGVRVSFGTIYSEILDTAEELGCDLIVMASHRPGLEQFLLGPNAAKVVRHARCSVFVVRD